MWEDCGREGNRFRRVVGDRLKQVVSLRSVVGTASHSCALGPELSDVLSEGQHMEMGMDGAAPTGAVAAKRVPAVLVDACLAHHLGENAGNSLGEFKQRGRVRRFHGRRYMGFRQHEDVTGAEGPGVREDESFDRLEDDFIRGGSAERATVISNPDDSGRTGLIGTGDISVLLRLAGVYHGLRASLIARTMSSLADACGLVRVRWTPREPSTTLRGGENMGLLRLAKGGGADPPGATNSHAKRPSRRRDFNRRDAAVADQRVRGPASPASAAARASRCRRGESCSARNAHIDTDAPAIAPEQPINP